MASARSRFRFGGLWLAFAAVALCLSSVTASASAPAAASVSAVQPLFQATARIGVGTQFLTNGRYDYIGKRAGQTASGTLFDERTGQRLTISKTGCHPDMFGGPWLLFSCGPNSRQFALYRLSHQSFKEVRRRVDGQPEAVGADWIDIEHFANCPDPNHCDQSSYHAYQSITTGQVIDGAGLEPESKLNTPAGRTIPDLNARQLTRTLCQPLRAPVLDPSNAAARGPIALYGHFLLATGSLDDSPIPQTYLQRCGSAAKHVLFPSPYVVPGYPAASVQIPSNPHVIVSPTRRQALSELLLPSLRRITIAIPTKAGPVLATTGNLDQIYLTARHLYLLDGRQLWSAPIPTTPSVASHR